MDSDIQQNNGWTFTTQDRALGHRVLWICGHSSPLSGISANDVSRRLSDLAQADKKQRL